MREGQTKQVYLKGTIAGSRLNKKNTDGTSLCIAQRAMHSRGYSALLSVSPVGKPRQKTLRLKLSPTHNYGVRIMCMI